ncbi:MAG: hypothetical protein EOP51_11185 [Sphingobacteriales bacterium]|nr:MAG: hypothetical protein EOP51_11185 [Sphingobacteriales bacterium]
MNNQILITLKTTEEETFAAVLGIGEDREAEIDSLMDKCHGETTTYPDAIAAAANHLHDANELAYVCFHLGAFAESQRSKHELLNKLLD